MSSLLSLLSLDSIMMDPSPLLRSLLWKHWYSFFYSPRGGVTCEALTLVKPVWLPTPRLNKSSGGGLEKNTQPGFLSHLRFMVTNLK